MSDILPVKPIHIAVVAGEFPKRSETFVLDQVLYLVRAGHEVTVLCERLGNKSILDASDRQTLKSARLLEWRTLPEWLARLLPWRIRQNLGRLLDHGTFRSLNPEVVLAHFGSNGARVVPLLRAVQPPLVTVYHGRDVAAEWCRNQMADYRRLLLDGRLHLPVNRTFADLLIKAGAPTERVKTHHLGVAVGKYAFRLPQPDGPLRLLSICRLVEKKGIASAIQALALLRADAPGIDWRYEIGGEGPEEAALRDLVSEQGLTDRVHFLGPLNHEEVLRRIAGADALLQPSVTAADGDQEGIPVVLMEAMAIGTIVCTTRHSGIPELVEDGVSGLLSDEHDAAGLAQNLKRLASGGVDISAMAKAARMKIQTDFSDELQNEALLRHCLNAARSNLADSDEGSRDRYP